MLFSWLWDWVSGPWGWHGFLIMSWQLLGLVDLHQVDWDSARQLSPLSRTLCAFLRISSGMCSAQCWSDQDSESAKAQWQLFTCAEHWSESEQVYRREGGDHQLRDGGFLSFLGEASFQGNDYLGNPLPDFWGPFVDSWIFVSLGIWPDSGRNMCLWLISANKMFRSLSPFWNGSKGLTFILREFIPQTPAPFLKEFPSLNHDLWHNDLIRTFLLAQSPMIVGAINFCNPLMVPSSTGLWIPSIFCANLLYTLP